MPEGEETFNVKNTTNHPLHPTYRDAKGMPVHVTIEPGKTGKLPRTEMLTAVLNPFVEHKGELVPADDECQTEVDKYLPTVKTAAAPLPVKETQKKGNKPGRE